MSILSASPLQPADAIAAIERGDLPGAQALCDALAKSGARPPWIQLAQLAARLGDEAAEGAALEALLRADRGDLPGLVAMAELRRRQGDLRAAGDWYRLLLATAAGAGTTLPPQLGPILERAEAFLRDTSADYAEHLFAALRAEGLDPAAMGPRVGHALDLLTGKAQLYLQQPSMFYFPGLPQRAFYERDEFDWVTGVEAEADAIAGELAALLGSDDDGFAPYVAAAPGRPAPNNPLLDDPSWGACHLWKNGAPVESVAPRCPAAMAALALAPIPVISGRSPMALFSRLRPGTHIKPHHGMLNTRLICHLPLVVPEGCALRVGHETRAWERGRMLLFDDSVEHEAWNRGSADRIILLFEIWKPEITPEERAVLTRIFAAIDLYGD